MGVKIYTVKGCPNCRKAKEYLKENNVEFEEIDLSNNPEKVKELQQISGSMSTPTLDIGGNIIVGFDQDRIKKALNL